METNQCPFGSEKLATPRLVTHPGKLPDQDGLGQGYLYWRRDHGCSVCIPGAANSQTLALRDCLKTELAGLASPIVLRQDGLV